MAGTLVANTINTDTGVFTTNNAYLGIAKAWAEFNGVSGVTINNSFNVSSITRNSTGNYTLNFTVAMPNANYVAVGSDIGSSSGGSYGYISTTTNAKTTTTCQFGFLQGTTFYDQNPIGIVFFGS